MPEADEIEFHQAMVRIYAEAKKVNYNATRFIQMVGNEWGLASAHQLLRGALPSEGFETLRSVGRLDLTVEAHVLKPEFRRLFSPDELAVARTRLIACGYSVPD